MKNKRGDAMLSLESVQEKIKNLKPYLDKQYAVSGLYIFGSFARNEQTDASDIDILIDFRKTPDLLTFLEIEEFLSQKLGHKIDLVPRRKLKSRLREQIMEEALAV